MAIVARARSVNAVPPAHQGLQWYESGTRVSIGGTAGALSRRK